MKRLKANITFIGALALSLLATDSFAGQSEDFAKVINVAGRQRMLSQKMIKELTLIKLKVRPVANSEHFNETISTFDTSLAALINGQKVSGIIPPPSQKTRAQLGIVFDLWGNYRQQLNAARTSGSVDLNALNKLAIKVLKEMNKGVEHYVEAAKEKGVKSTGGQVINVAGRQRMLSQKISKAIFLLALGDQSARREIKNSLKLFKQSHNALIYGNELMEIPKTEHPVILEKMAQVDRMWTEFHGIAKAIIAAKNVNKEQLERIAEINVPLLKTMNEAVGIYEKYAQEGTVKQASAK